MHPARSLTTACVGCRRWGGEHLVEEGNPCDPRSAPQVVIKYVPYVGDSKRAMDEYTSELMLGGTNTLVLHNTCEVWNVWGQEWDHPHLPIPPTT